MIHSDLSIDKDSPVPLYHQVRQELEAMILRGDYQPDQDLPTEGELAQVFQVSRVTIRQAVADMLEDGLLYRKRSRGRLQIAAPRVERRLTRLQGFFTEDMLTSNLRPQVVVLSVQTTSAEQLTGFLGVAKEAHVFRVERLFESDGEPLTYQISYIPVSVCPNLDQKDLSLSLFRYVEEAYQQPIVRAVQRVRVREATRREAQLLGLAPYAYVLQVDRTSYATDGVAVEYFVCTLRVDRYDFLMELNRTT